jgi:hypothetical protein
LDAPIPAVHIEHAADIHMVIVEELSALIGEFRRRDRHPATVRELVAVCHVASRVAGHFAPREDQSQQVTDAWTNARDTIGLFADGIALPPPGAARSRILGIAMQIESSIRHTELEHRGPRADVEASQRAVALRCLRQLSLACETEIVKIGPTLAVPPGSRPLSHERVRQWLRKDTFRAAPPDVFVAVSRLRSAGGASPSCLSAERNLLPTIA